MQISEDVIHRGRSGYPHNSSHHTKAEFNNYFTVHSKIFLSSQEAYLPVDFLQNFCLFLGKVSGYKQILQNVDKISRAIFFA